MSDTLNPGALDICFQHMPAMVFKMYLVLIECLWRTEALYLRYSSHIRPKPLLTVHLTLNLCTD